MPCSQLLQEVSGRRLSVNKRLTAKVEDPLWLVRRARVIRTGWVIHLLRRQIHLLQPLRKWGQKTTCYGDRKMGSKIDDLLRTLNSRSMSCRIIELSLNFSTCYL